MDHPISISDRALARLRSLGAAQPEGPLADLFAELTAAPDTFVRKAALLAAFRRALAVLAKQADVDRAAVADTLEAVLDLLHIDSSDGLLNEWLLGISL